MALLAVVAFQGDRLALALIMAAQHQWVDDITVGAEQAHLPAGEALEQPGPFAALPVNQAPGCPVFQIHTLLSLRCRKCHISSSSITTASPGGGLLQ